MVQSGAQGINIAPRIGHPPRVPLRQWCRADGRLTVFKRTLRDAPAPAISSARVQPPIDRAAANKALVPARNDLRIMTGILGN